MERTKKLRERLAKHRRKIAELEAKAVEMEQEIKKAEEEQLGYLARSAANNLSGGMEEIFELLRNLKAKPDTGEVTIKPPKNESNNNSDESKEGEADYGIDKTEESES